MVDALRVREGVVTLYDLLALACEPRVLVPILRCHGCGYSLAAAAAGGSWTCPRRDCGVTNLAPEEGP